MAINLKLPSALKRSLCTDFTDTTVSVSGGFSTLIAGISDYRFMRINPKGFSLLELMVSISVLAILASLSVGIYLDYKQKTYHMAAKVMMRNAITAIEAADEQYGALTYQMNRGSATCAATPFDGAAQHGLGGEVCLPGCTPQENHFLIIEKNLARTYAVGWDHRAPSNSLDPGYGIIHGWSYSTLNVDPGRYAGIFPNPQPGGQINEIYDAVRY